MREVYTAPSAETYISNIVQKCVISKAVQCRDARDRKQFHNPKDLATAIAIEAAELQEHFLRKSQEQSYQLAQTTEAKEEFADIFIFLMEYADIVDIDIKKEVLAKLEKAAIKYPVDKSKGRSGKYTKPYNSSFTIYHSPLQTFPSNLLTNPYTTNNGSEHTHSIFRIHHQT